MLHGWLHVELLPSRLTFCVHHTMEHQITGKLQALVYDILPSTTAVFSYAMWSRKLSANEQFFVCAQTVVSLLQTTQIKTRRVIYSRQHSLHQHKYNHNRLNRDRTLSFTRGGCVSRLRACLGARLLPQSYQYSHSEHRFPATSSKGRLS